MTPALALLIVGACIKHVHILVVVVLYNYSLVTPLYSRGALTFFQAVKNFYMHVCVYDKNWFRTFTTAGRLLLI